MFKGYNVGNKGCEVSLLQYIDDTIFVGETSVRNVMIIKTILRIFELVYGLRVNFFKSCFRATGVESCVIEIYVDLLNCRLLTFPFVYLNWYPHWGKSKEGAHVRTNYSKVL